MKHDVTEGQHCGGRVWFLISCWACLSALLGNGRGQGATERGRCCRYWSTHTHTQMHANTHKDTHTHAHTCKHTHANTFTGSCSLVLYGFHFPDINRILIQSNVLVCIVYRCYSISILEAYDLYMICIWFVYDLSLVGHTVLWIRLRDISEKVSIMHRVELPHKYDNGIQLALGQEF